MARQNECVKCGNIVEGNIRPIHEVVIKCSDCVQGEVEYVISHPDEFPEAHETLHQIKQRQLRERLAARADRLRGK